MQRILILFTLLTVVLFSDCSEAGSDKPKAVAPSPTPFKTRSESKDRSVKEDLERFAAEAKGKVGLDAIDLENGEFISLNGDGHYPMQSVYKLPIAMAVLKEYADQQLDIDQKIAVTKEDFVRPGLRSPIRDKFPHGAEMSVRDLIKYAIEESDGTASDVLLRIAGGPARVQAYLTDLGITDMKIVDSEKEIGADWKTQYENWSTPGAAVSLLQALYEGRALSPNGREILLGYMTNSTPGAKRIKGLLEGSPVAHKTGTSGAQNGITAATNDIGIVSLPNGKHLAIAIFVSDSSADEKTRELAIAKLSKVLWNYWNRGS